MKEISIAGTKILPGQKKTISLDVARLPSGTPIHIHVHVFRSAKPGPSILVMGGVHGDEVNGVEIVRRLLVSDVFEKITCGTAVVISLLNVYGFINFSRDLPDGKDVNRSFPGSKNGSLASRVAWCLTNQILPLIDCGIDFHTGGSSRYNYPQIRYSEDDEASEKLAVVFHAPYTIGNTPIHKSFRKTALEMGKPILVFEGGESLRYDGYSIEEGIAGVLRVLQHLGMYKNAMKSKKEALVFKKTSWLRASRSGLFIWHKDSGNEVKEGEFIGEINDPDGTEHTPVIAHRTGYIIGHNNAPVVSQGDALFHIGYDL